MARLLISRTAVGASHRHEWALQLRGFRTASWLASSIIQHVCCEVCVVAPETPFLRSIGRILRLVVVVLIFGRHREARGRAVAPNVFKLFQR